MLSVKKWNVRGLRACARACVCACVRFCVCACTRLCLRSRVRVNGALMLAHACVHVLAYERDECACVRACVFVCMCKTEYMNINIDTRLI